MSEAGVASSPHYHTATLLLPRRYVRATRASKSLCRQYLIVHIPQIHAVAPPRVDVVGKGDGLVAPSRSFRRPDTPELHERPVALNVRPVSVGLEYIVSATITVHGA